MYLLSIIYGNAQAKRLLIGQFQKSVQRMCDIVLLQQFLIRVHSLLFENLTRVLHRRIPASQLFVAMVLGIVTGTYIFRPYFENRREQQQKDRDIKKHEPWDVVLHSPVYISYCSVTSSMVPKILGLGLNVYILIAKTNLQVFGYYNCVTILTMQILWIQWELILELTLPASHRTFYKH